MDVCSHCNLHKRILCVEVILFEIQAPKAFRIVIGCRCADELGLSTLKARGEHSGDLREVLDLDQVESLSGKVELDNGALASEAASHVGLSRNLDMRLELAIKFKLL